MLYAAAQTIVLGRRAGWCSALGFHLAGFLHIAAAAFGVSALLQVVPQLFVAMKLAGAIYLIWLGVKYLRGHSPSASPDEPIARRPAWKALRDGIVVEVLNPKSVLFYFAFLPQFIDASAAWPVWAQIVILGMIVNMMFSLTDAFLIELSHALVNVLKAAPRVVMLLQRIGGGVLIAIGANLAFARQ